MQEKESIEFNENIPIYLQLMERIRHEIISGKLEPGSKIEAVRTLANKFAVNPNTVQKALSELEGEELVYTQRTAGRYVTENTLIIESMRYKEAKRITDTFINQMKSLGYLEEEILAFLPN
ncbi:MAG: GntR family transcriptional regulator [Candidatus Fimenecus sp.]